MKRSLVLHNEDETFHLRIRRRWDSVKVVVDYACVVVPCLSRRLAACVSGGVPVPGWEPLCEGCGRGFLGHDYACIRLASPGPVDRKKPILPENSHVISLGQFLMCLENVGIATTQFQRLKYGSGNYVRHLWGTMRVCGDLAGRWQEERAGRAAPVKQVPRP